MFISFGNASGSVAPINIGMLGQKGSLKSPAQRCSHISAKHDTCQSMASHLFDKVTSGQVKLRIDQTLRFLTLNWPMTSWKRDKRLDAVLSPLATSVQLC